MSPWGQSRRAPIPRRKKSSGSRRRVQRERHPLSREDRNLASDPSRRRDTPTSGRGRSRPTCRRTRIGRGPLLYRRVRRCGSTPWRPSEPSDSVCQAPAVHASVYGSAGESDAFHARLLLVRRTWAPRIWLTPLSSWPVHSPVNASLAAARSPAHDLGPAARYALHRDGVAPSTFCRSPGAPEPPHYETRSGTSRYCRARCLVLTDRQQKGVRLVGLKKGNGCDPIVERRPQHAPLVATVRYDCRGLGRWDRGAGAV